jgi:hypothetical protein
LLGTDSIQFNFQKEKKRKPLHIILYYFSILETDFVLAWLTKKKGFLSSSICSLTVVSKSSDLPLLSCLSRQGLLSFAAFVGCGFGLYQLGSDNLLGRVFVPC